MEIIADITTRITEMGKAISPALKFSIGIGSVVGVKNPDVFSARPPPIAEMATMEIRYQILPFSTPNLNMGGNAMAV